MIKINDKMVNKDIKKLVLFNKKLTQLPVEIGHLSQLTILYLSFNQLTHLPVEICHITQLNELDLSKNQLPIYQ